MNVECCDWFIGVHTQKEQTSSCILILGTVSDPEATPISVVRCGRAWIGWLGRLVTFLLYSRLVKEYEALPTFAGEKTLKHLKLKTKQ